MTEMSIAESLPEPTDIVPGQHVLAHVTTQTDVDAPQDVDQWIEGQRFIEARFASRFQHTGQFIDRPGILHLMMKTVLTRDRAEEIVLVL